MEDELLDAFGELLSELDLDLGGLEATSSVLAESTELFSLEVSHLELELEADGGREFFGDVTLDESGTIDLEPEVGGDPLHDLDAGHEHDGAEPGAGEDGEAGSLFGATGVIRTEGAYAPEEGFVVSHGDPAAAMETHHPQEASHSCAIACQRDIIHELTGSDPSEESLARLAEQRSWYTPGEGTLPGHIGLLLKTSEIDVEQPPDASLDDLQRWVEDEKRCVIVCIDSAELYQDPVLHDCTLDEVRGMPGSSHAVRVTGFEKNPLTEEQLVVLNDPALGPGLKVPAAIFEDAWQDTGQFACVTAPRR
jgi:hypothetical protein